MESKKLIFSIYNVSEYLYCQRSCFYKIFHFEENQEDNADMIKGRNEHDVVHSDSTRYPQAGIKQITNLSVFSKNYNLNGRLDLLEIMPNNIYIPIEYKKGKFRDFINHKIQLCLQAICLEEMYKTQIKYGCLFFIEEHKRYRVNLDHILRELAINTINEIKNKILLNDANLFLKNKNTLCEKCSFFQTCLPFIEG